jgi:hypothetical protein
MENLIVIGVPKKDQNKEKTYKNQFIYLVY